MDVYRAKTAGFCMGVSLALQKLNTALERKGGAPETTRICTLGPIIHNPQVLAEYESRGVVCVKEAAQLHPGDVAVIRAHGITRQVEEQVKQSGADIVDATCPKVKKAQLSIGRATADGATLLLFGEADHPEVRGLVSYACGPAHVFGTAAELESLHLAENKAYVLASQTTQDRQIFQEIVEDLRTRIADLVVLSTICDAARERHRAPVEAAARAARRYRDMFAARDLHHRRYLRGIRRFDDRLRHVSPDAARLVPGIIVKDLGVVHYHAAGAGDGEQLFIYLFRYFPISLHQ